MPIAWSLSAHRLVPEYPLDGQEICNFSYDAFPIFLKFLIRYANEDDSPSK